MELSLICRSLEAKIGELQLFIMIGEQTLFTRRGEAVGKGNGFNFNARDFREED